MNIGQNNVKYTYTTRSKLTIERLHGGFTDIRIKINPDDVLNQDRIVSMCEYLCNVCTMYKFTKLKGSFKYSQKTGLYRIHLRDEITVGGKGVRISFAKLVENDYVNYIPH